MGIIQYLTYGGNEIMALGGNVDSHYRLPNMGMLIEGEILHSITFSCTKHAINACFCCKAKDPGMKVISIYLFKTPLGK